MQLEPGLDTGPTLLQREMEIGPDEAAPELAGRLAEAGAPLVVETLRKLDRSEIVPVPQDHSQATMAPMLKKEDGRIDWSQPAEKIYNRIRGLQPWPGAYTSFRGQLCHLWGRPAPGGASDKRTPDHAATQGSILLIGGELFAACGLDTRLRIETAQLEGRKRVTSREFANGARLKLGEHFGD